MVRLTIVRAIPAEPTAVLAAYRRWVLSGTSDKPGESFHEASELPGGQIRFRRGGRVRAGLARVEGVITELSGTEWSCRQEIELDGRPYSRETQRYHVAPREGGSDLTVEFEVHARSALHDFLLEFGHGRLLRDRSRELDRWVPGDQPG